MSRADGDNWTAQKYTQDHGADLYRRTMYTFWKRTVPPPALAIFDAAGREACTVRLGRTNTPLQALHLANDQVFVELAEGLAERIVAASMTSDAERVDYAFRLCVAREPSSEEREVVLALLREQQKKQPETAWLLVARTLLKLDEFVTRE